MKQSMITLGFLLFMLAWGQATLQPPFAGGESDVSYDMVMDTEQVQGYTFERWVNREAYENNDTYRTGVVLRIISPTGQHYDMHYNPILGWELDDLTNDGIAEVIISSFSGGAHCCTTTVVLELQSGNLNELFRLNDADCDISIEDIDGDGTQELVGCDDIWVYSHCGPLPKMVWAWDGAQFSVANWNPAYQKVFASDIARGANMVFSRIERSKLNDSDCVALWVVLPYLYQGKQAHARAALEFFYDDDADSYPGYPDSSEVWRYVLEKAESSPLYQAVVQSLNE